LRAWLARVGHRQPLGPLDSAASVEEMRAEWDRELAERTGASPEDHDAR
jgi:hypothetical protein